MTIPIQPLKLFLELLAVPFLQSAGPPCVPELFASAKVHTDIANISVLQIGFMVCRIEEGYFRSEVNYEFISKVGRQFSIIFRTQEEYAMYDMREIFVSFVCTLLRGICTEKGIAKLDSFLQENELV